MILRKRGLLEIAADADMLSPSARVHHTHSVHPARVDLPPLQIGATFLERWPVREEPGVISWRSPGYECMAPATFILRDVIVHSSAGILQVGDDVVAETLGHCAPDVYGFRSVGHGIELLPRDTQHLAGRHVTVLAGNKRNYFHAMMDGVCRLSMLPDYYLQASQNLLHPWGAVAQREILDLAALPAGLGRIEVRDTDAFHVEELVFPWDLYGLSSFHPCILQWLDAISARVPGSRAFPRRFYIDRGGSGLRPLVDEDAVVEQLRKLGFVAMRPETLSVADQIRLFRGAEAIVAPHGAALANICFCRPGCVLLELHMDAYVHWCYRHLAALRGLIYDCVLGQADGAWPEAPHLVHGLRWRIHAPHVAAAAAHLLQQAMT